MMTCANGHENPDDPRFCGECGISTLADPKLCVYGHINHRQRNFCGDCGAPLTSPVAADSEGTTGRWAVDPTGRHQFRYLEGDAWTHHVADIGNGTFGVDPPLRSQRSRTGTWVGLAAGVAVLLLVVSAISAAAITFSRPGQADPDVVRAQQSVAHPTAVPPAQYLPTPTAFRPLAVIGAPCPPGSINGVQSDGSIAYCELLEETNTYMWSMYPGTIDSPYPPGTPPDEREDPGIAVCMMQNVLPRAACVAQLPK